jgi:hypothetical protein
MKTSRFLLISALIASSAAVLSAGQGYQYWSKATTPNVPAASATQTQSCSTCACCAKAH